MASSGAGFSSVVGWLGVAAVIGGIAVAAVETGRDSAARDAVAASGPTSGAAPSDRPARPSPPAESYRQAVVAIDSASGVPASAPTVTKAHPDPLPMPLDVATGIPRPERKTAETLEPQPARVPSGGPANGVVTDPATGVTHVNGPGSSSGR
jgi:hypothetical protein